MGEFCSSGWPITWTKASTGGAAGSFLTSFSDILDLDFSDLDFSDLDFSSFDSWLFKSAASWLVSSSASCSATLKLLALFWIIG